MNDPNSYLWSLCQPGDIAKYPKGLDCVQNLRHL